MIHFRSNKKTETDWSTEEEAVFMDMTQRYMREGLLEGNTHVDQFREVMMSRHLVSRIIQGFIQPKTKCYNVMDDGCQM